MEKERITGKKVVIYVITLVLSVAYLVVGYNIATSSAAIYEKDASSPMYTKGRVTEITEKVEESNDSIGSSSTVYYIKVEMLDGHEKGNTVVAAQSQNSYTAIPQKVVEVGDKILLVENADPTVKANWLFVEYVRIDAMIWLGVAFVLFVILFGRFKGVNTVISLAFTCLAVFAVFIPAVLNGQNIYIWSIISCIYMTLMTLFIVLGANRQCYAAIIGCLSGLALTGILTFVMDKIIRLSGMVNDDSIYLALLSEDRPLDLRAIIFAAILIGAVGAIMDVCMDISSALWELHQKRPDMNARELFRSGMKIGRDIMGTMANTLVLAYIGSSLSVTLLLTAYSSSLQDLFNREMIIVELLQALVGSFGILFTIPFTSIVCAVLYHRGKQRQDDWEQNPWEEVTPPPFESAGEMVDVLVEGETTIELEE